MTKASRFLKCDSIWSKEFFSLKVNDLEVLLRFIIFLISHLTSAWLWVSHLKIHFLKLSLRSLRHPCIPDRCNLGHFTDAPWLSKFLADSGEPGIWMQISQSSLLPEAADVLDSMRILWSLCHAPTEFNRETSRLICEKTLNRLEGETRHKSCGNNCQMWVTRRDATGSPVRIH